MMNEWNLPRGWKLKGWIPPGPTPTPSDDQLDLLVEDLLHIETPGGSIVIDVGWYPEADPSGHFVCILVEDEAWEEPLARETMRDAAEVRSWIERTVQGVDAWLRRHPKARDVAVRTNERPREQRAA
jgi:hypothetical protein